MHEDIYVAENFASMISIWKYLQPCSKRSSCCGNSQRRHPRSFGLTAAVKPQTPSGVTILKTVSENPIVRNKRSETYPGLEELLLVSYRVFSVVISKQGEITIATYAPNDPKKIQISAPSRVTTPSSNGSREHTPPTTINRSIDYEGTPFLDNVSLVLHEFAWYSLLMQIIIYCPDTLRNDIYKRFSTSQPHLLRFMLSLSFTPNNAGKMLDL
ncbi:unnamed protein product [Caenorhabditis nigoni]